MNDLLVPNRHEVYFTSAALYMAAVNLLIMFLELELK